MTEEVAKAGVMVALLLCSWGCSKWYYQRQVTWGYVFDIGDAEAITEWTLSREEPEQVVDGLATLADLTAFRSGAEAQRALEGYLRVHRKLLAMWPGLNVPKETDGTTLTLEKVLEISRVYARGKSKGNPESEAAQVLWERLQELDPAAQDEPRRKTDKPPLLRRQ